MNYVQNVSDAPYNRPLGRSDTVVSVIYRDTVEPRLSERFYECRDPKRQFSFLHN